MQTLHSMARSFLLGLVVVATTCCGFPTLAPPRKGMMHSRSDGALGHDFLSAEGDKRGRERRIHELEEQLRERESSELELVRARTVSEEKALELEGQLKEAELRARRLCHDARGPVAVALM